MARNDKEIQIKIPIEPNATPIAQEIRRVKYQSVEPSKKCAEEFEASEIIELVPEHGTITWCFPVVFQPLNPRTRGTFAHDLILG